MPDISNDAQRFIDVCEISGIAFRMAGSNGIRIKECPFCGDSQWKAWMYAGESSTGGSCAKCGSKYGYRSFLLSTGIDRSVVDRYLKSSFREEVTIEDEEPSEKEKEAAKAIEVPALWMYINEMPTHPASLYAKKRGVPEDLYSTVMISPGSNSVAFLCHNLDGVLVGYQTRYVAPGNGPKTLLMPGFKSQENIMLYVRTGKPLVVCEGPFDAVSAYVLGYSAACCFGSAMGRTQMDLIDRALGVCKSPFLIAGLDLDDAGKKAKNKLLAYCNDRGIPVKVAYPETGKDINESVVAGKGIVLQEEEPELFLSSLF
jgi:transcription elongation factor Elf1